MIDIVSESRKYYDELVTHRRYFHEHAELGFKETETIAYIMKELDKAGISYRYPVGSNGIVATVKGKKPGKTVAFRGDMDALPIQELTKLPFASKNDHVMHACGHDAHTSLVLTVAKSMKEHEDELTGNAVFIFQHAEELPPGGAREMVADGCLDGVDVIYGAHVKNGEKAGSVGCEMGITHGTNCSFHVEIEGISGHSSIPLDTVDTVLLASQCITLIHNMRDRYANPMDPVTVNIGAVHGGDAVNIICDYTRFSGMIRAMKGVDRDRMMNQIEKTVKAVVEAAGGICKIKRVEGYPAVDNKEREVGVLIKAAEKLGMPYIPSGRGLGGEDFSYYLDKVPGCIFRIYSGPEDGGSFYPAHHPKFVIDEKSMKAGFKAFWQIFKIENDME